MESEFIVSEKLEELARSSNRFSSPVKPQIDYEQEYIEVFRAFGLSEFEIEDQLDKWELAKIKAERFYKRNPKYQIIYNILDNIYNEVKDVDTRDQELITYNIAVVLFVVLLAGMCNCNDDAEIAEFWFFNNMELQYLIPGMPSPKHMISDETVRTIRKLVPEDVMHSIFIKYFNEIKTCIAEMILNKDYDSQHYRKTLGGDGQELRATFREGSLSRKQKGGHGVSIYDCDNQTVVGFKTVHKKNQEVQAFIDILDKITIEEDAIFYADALNLRDILIGYLDSRKIDWLFPVKSNNGNKWLRDAIKTAFNDNSENSELFTHDSLEKISGRLEETSFMMLNAEMLPDEIRKHYGNAATIIKVLKKTSKYCARNTTPDKQPRAVKTERYYISSLEPTHENFRQLIHSIGVRWYFETHHNTLDCFFLQDNQALCNKDNICATVAKNKILYNVTSYARQRLSQEGFRRTRFRTETSEKRKPLSFKMTRQALASDIYLAFKVLIDYFMENNNCIESDA